MKMLSHLLQTFQGIQMKAFLILSVPPLIGKLGEERVDIRNEAFFLLRQLIFLLRKNTLLNNLILFLYDQFENKFNSNWHTKEEILNLISILFLNVFENNRLEEWYQSAFKTNGTVEEDIVRFYCNFLKKILIQNKRQFRLLVFNKLSLQLLYFWMKKQLKLKKQLWSV